MPENQRDIRVKLKILHTIDCPISEISIDTICKKADISRQTFYNHFKSKYDILPWWGIWCDEQFVDQIWRRYSWEEGFLRGSYLFNRQAQYLVEGVQVR